MTHKQAQFNADVMTKVITHNLLNGGNAKIAYDGCEPGVQALIRCQLTHSQKRALGIVADDEPDPLELALHTRTRERQEELLGKKFDVLSRLKTAMAMSYYEYLRTS